MHFVNTKVLNKVIMLLYHISYTLLYIMYIIHMTYIILYVYDINYIIIYVYSYIIYYYICK